MTKEEIKRFIVKYPSINSNEIIEVHLKNGDFFAGHFGTQESANELLNKWVFTNIFNENQTLINGEDILKLNFCRDGEDVYEIKLNI
jgi:hypothetical protein